MICKKKIMDNKTREELRIMVREMKKPAILINPDDLDALKMELELINHTNPTYNGIPIKTNKFLKNGELVVYDDIEENFLNSRNKPLSLFS